MSVTKEVSIERHAAERMYADLIVAHGNPHYFIFKFLQNVENEVLEEKLKEMADKAAGGNAGHTFSIFDEE
ncbi:hypothetical protein [Rhizobium sp. MHM7A]|uniref:hypothetical protein n=1 Tax=Rhizobium sp. MHM7A TaxID=2583233 RepID=UPI001105FAD3|nr:hypothetical protein [Rhizobium sp. MHM7A]TLX15992.1 hypothetical protein FFR93_01355 [Rhizobium sp. MHM7A]